MMTLDAIQHMLKAAGEVTKRERFVLVGSAAVIAWEAGVPPTMTLTSEIDIYALDTDDPEAVSFEIDSILGHGSPFHATHGYHVDGVGPRTARLPNDWQARSRLYQTERTGEVTAVVPEPNDIAASKLVRCSEKDLDFILEGLAHGIFDLGTVIERARTIDISDLDQGAMADKIAILLGRLSASQEPIP